MNLLARIGARTRAQWSGAFHVTAVAWTALAMTVRPRCWPQPVRNVLARQILFTGVDAWRFMSFIALLVGVTVVASAQVLMKQLGQSALLGPVLVTVIVNQIGPLLANFVVIGRSGNAMATEMANMKITGEVHLLDAMGLDPFVYLVLPRVIGAAVSIFCLSIIFVVVSFISGYIFGGIVGANTGDPTIFMRSVFTAITGGDFFSLVVKSFVPGLLMGAICCSEGLSVGASITEVPQATTRAVVRSTAALFITVVIVSLMVYV